jgi:hypothetical protein
MPYRAMSSPASSVTSVKRPVPSFRYRARVGRCLTLVSGPVTGVDQQDVLVPAVVGIEYRDAGADGFGQQPLAEGAVDMGEVDAGLGGDVSEAQRPRPLGGVAARAVAAPVPRPRPPLTGAWRGRPTTRRSGPLPRSGSVWPPRLPTTGRFGRLRASPPSSCRDVCSGSFTVVPPPGARCPALHGMRSQSYLPRHLQCPVPGAVRAVRRILHRSPRRLRAADRTE